MAIRSNISSKEFCLFKVNASIFFISLVIKQYKGCCLNYFFLGTKTKLKPLLQYLLLVGLGPSSKRCP